MARLMADLPNWMGEKFVITPTIQWYVEMPKDGEVRESPVFDLRGVEVNFKIGVIVASDKKEGSYFLRIMKTNYASCPLLRRCAITIFADLMNDPISKFKVRCCNITDLPAEIWSTIDSDPVRPSVNYYSESRCMRFVLLFPNESGLVVEPNAAKHELDEDSSNLLLNNLSTDFSKMLESTAFSDVQIECNGGVVQAHRAVLASRSKVFDRMFQADMEESRTGILEMIDADVSAVKLFLEFIYSGNIGNPSVDMVYCLYKLADKYDVPTLKNLCSGLMAKYVSKGL